MVVTHDTLATLTCRGAFDLVLEMNVTSVCPTSVHLEGYMLPLRCLCSPSLRSLQFELDRVGFGPSGFSSTQDGDAAACAPRALASGVLGSLSAEATHRPSSDYLDDGAQSLAVASTATAVGVVAAPLPLSVLAERSTRHTAVVGAGKWASFGVEEANVTLSTPPVNDQMVCSNVSDNNRDASTAVCAEDDSRMPPLRPTNAGADANVTPTSRSEDAPLNEGLPFPGGEHMEASEDPADRIAGASIIFDDGVPGVGGVVDRVDDATFFDNVTEGGVGLLGEECQWGGIHLTDEDLQDAAEALMCSSLFHEEPSEAIGSRL